MIWSAALTFSIRTLLATFVFVALLINSIILKSEWWTCASINITVFVLLAFTIKTFIYSKFDNFNVTVCAVGWFYFLSVYCGAFDILEYNLLSSQLIRFAWEATSNHDARLVGMVVAGTSVAVPAEEFYRSQMSNYMFYSSADYILYASRFQAYYYAAHCLCGVVISVVSATIIQIWIRYSASPKIPLDKKTDSRGN